MDQTTQEIWKAIAEYSGYEVSNLGRVRSIDGIRYSPRGNYFAKGTILNPDKSGNGYHRVTLFRNGFRRKYLVHRLVAIAFIPNPLNLPQVNHKFGNLDDNRAESLEWVTGQENSDHKWNTLIDRAAFADKLRRSDRARKIGDSHRGGKSVSAIPVINNITGIKYECITEAARENNIAKSSLRYFLSTNSKNTDWSFL